MEWFYNEQISLLGETNGYLNHGVWVSGEITPVKIISCDIQPSNREQIYKDYGYYVDCTFRVFCEPDNDLQIGGLVLYNGNQYIIVKIIKWDDYLDMFVSEL